MTLIYILASAVGLAFTILIVMALIAQIKTYRLLNEIADSGGLANLRVYRVKKQAKEMIDAGYIYNVDVGMNLLKQLEDINDKESRELIQQLEALFKPKK